MSVPRSSDPTSPRPWSNDELDEFVRRACARGADVEILRQRPDSLVARVPVSLDRVATVIVKLWIRPGLRGLLRRVTRTGSVLREYRTLGFLHRAGMRVPAPLGYRPVRIAAVAYTDALIVQDIGESVTALTYVKRLVAAGDAAGLTAFEDELIEMTRSLLAAGVVDPDHGLLNVVVQPDGHAVRLDFEIARKVVFPRLAPRALAETLGRLIASYTFALQPDVERVRAFAQRLVDRLQPPPSVLRRCSRYVHDRMDRQREQRQIDVNVRLPWESPS